MKLHILKNHFKKGTQRAVVRMFMRATALVALLVFALPAQAFVSPVVPQHNFYHDTEESKENVFGAGALDIVLAPTSTSASMVQSASTTLSTTLTNTGTIAPRYRLSATHATSTCSDTFFNSIEVRALLNGSEVYRGALGGLAALPHTGTFGAWDFEMTVVSSYTPPALPETCVFDIDFSAWRDGASEAESGFSDVERFTGTLTLVDAPVAPLAPPAPTGVVLNEILPDPTGSDEAVKPGGEWVELYNNDSAPVDVAGWKIKDATGSAWTISTLNTHTGSTTIAAHGWLVVYRNGASMALNNDGDTVSLYTAASVLLDTHTYGVTPVNKSHARIPDGTGAWVDPIPTPGEPNQLEENINTNNEDGGAPIATTNGEIGTDVYTTTTNTNTNTNTDTETLPPAMEPEENIPESEPSKETPPVIEQGSEDQKALITEVKNVVEDTPSEETPASEPEPAREEEIIPAS